MRPNQIMTAPWYERWSLDPAFPFRLGTGEMRGFTAHWHELVEIVYVAHGSLAITVDGERHTVSGRDIIIINSGQIHGFERTESDNELVIVQFGLDIFGQATTDLRDGDSGRSIFARSTVVEPGTEPLHELLEACIIEISDEHRAARPGSRLAIRARLSDIALAIMRNVSAPTPGSPSATRRRTRHETLERVFEFVSHRFTEPITLDDAAQVASLSRYYFSRFFREQTGQPFQRYVLRVRVAHAERLLAESDLPVTEIAFQSGFGSPKTFNRVFRQLVGCSPTEYRSASVVLS